MGKPLGMALRVRVAAYVDEGHGHREAARHFRVSPRFVNELMKLRRETGLLERWEAVAWNARVQFFAPGETPFPKVKVILIDQMSLDWGKREMALPWPWPREVYGPIIDFCRRSGARSARRWLRHESG